MLSILIPSAGFLSTVLPSHLDHSLQRNISATSFRFAWKYFCIIVRTFTTDKSFTTVPPHIQYEANIHQIAHWRTIRLVHDCRSLWNLYQRSRLEAYRGWIDMCWMEYNFIDHAFACTRLKNMSTMGGKYRKRAANLFSVACLRLLLLPSPLVPRQIQPRCRPLCLLHRSVQLIAPMSQAGKFLIPLLTEHSLSPFWFCRRIQFRLLWGVLGLERMTKERKIIARWLGMESQSVQLAPIATE